MADSLFCAFERSLSLEKQALQKLHEMGCEDSAFRHAFFELATALTQTSQHVIFSGVGKSGYVARIVQSLFSSMGLPAFFLHPSDAVHGELGTMTASNFLILFSKSGKSAELLPLLTYAKQQHLRTAIITEAEHSDLKTLCDFSLKIPLPLESGLFGEAPTTSSLLFLALGSALATSVAEAKKITKAQFSEIHPAGDIGRKFQKEI